MTTTEFVYTVHPGVLFEEDKVIAKSKKLQLQIFEPDYFFNLNLMTAGDFQTTELKTESEILEIVTLDSLSDRYIVLCKNLIYLLQRNELIKFDIKNFNRQISNVKIYIIF